MARKAKEDGRKSKQETSRKRGKEVKEEEVAIYFADAHVDEFAWAGRPKLRGDSQFAFRSIVTYAIEHQIKHVIGAGDLIDVKRPPSAVVEFLRRQLSRLQKAGSRLCFIQGQHEASNPPWLAAIHQNPWWLDIGSADNTLGYLEVADNIRVAGLDWTPADRLEERLGTISEEVTTLVCHQVWREFMGSVTSPEGSLTQIPHATTVITGDFHRYVETSVTGVSGQKAAVYSPGPTNPRDILQLGSHYFLVQLSSGRIEKRVIPGRPCLLFPDIQTRQDVDRLLDNLSKQWQAAEEHAESNKLPDYLRKPIMYVVYPETLTNVYRRIVSAVGNNAFLFIKRERQLSKEMLAEATVQRRELLSQGLAGVLRHKIGEKSPDYAPLLRLLTSENPPAVELAAMRKERGLA